VKLKHYYHIYAEGRGPHIFKDHYSALTASGLLSKLDFVGVGIVGQPQNRDLVKRSLPTGIEVVVEADKGWEQVTMDAFDLSEPAKILYAHTKGASNPDKLRDMWRESMTNGTVHGWKTCVDLLDQGYSAVGCYWRSIPQQHFSGTFWWATSDYLNTLPRPVLKNTRFDAEMWIGHGVKGARIADLCPGPVHRLNILNRKDFTSEKLPPVPGYVSFYTTSKIAGFAKNQTHQVRLTPFIQSCIDKGHFQVIGTGYDPVKTFLIQ
jgi:hypothetical protein